MNAKRKRRVAEGSGTSVQTVNKVLKMHKEMGRAMKQIKKMGGLKGLASMFGGGGISSSMPSLEVLTQPFRVGGWEGTYC